MLFKKVNQVKKSTINATNTFDFSLFILHHSLTAFSLPFFLLSLPFIVSLTFLCSIYLYETQAKHYGMNQFLWQENVAENQNKLD